MRSVLARCFAGARRGAEPALALFDLRRDRQERVSARLACFTNGTRQATAPHYGQVVIGKTSPVARACAMRVARVAAWDEVLRSIVVPVVVKVIGEQGVWSSRTAKYPMNGISAPVATVFAGTDLLVEHKARNGNEPGGRREGMPARRLVPLALRFHNARASRSVPNASATTEPSRVAHAWLKRFPAGLADLHSHSLVGR